MTTYQIIQLLDNFTPFSEDNSEYDNESYFYEIMDELKSKKDVSLAIESIFKLIEKHPSTDFGSPGPLVHTIESLIGLYENNLFESLNRRPTPLTLWMLNRIINGEHNIIIKQNLIDRLSSYLEHPSNDKKTIDTIKEFLDHQNKIK